MNWYDGILGGMQRKGSPSSQPPPPAPEKKTLGEVCLALEDNLTLLEGEFLSPRNADLVLRRYTIGAVPACVVYMDGMAGRAAVNDFLLRQTMAPILEGVMPGKRMDALISHSISIGDVEKSVSLDEAVSAVLDGRSVLFVDGETACVLLETRGFEKRGVQEPAAETVVLGPNEGFTETMRTNITLIRRIVRAPDLVSEMLGIGTDMKTSCAILYVDSIANPAIVEEVKKRINAIDAPAVSNAGELMQWIEDRPNALVPQILLTERPDRAASFLLEGQVVVVVDGSTMVLAMPVTLFHMMHTSDDSFLRWQYGTLSRLVRFVGMIVSIWLPAMYLSVLVYHNELLPMDLLTAIAESHAMVPFPVGLETLAMTLALELISEAGMRIPASLGPSLSIIGALILGQAAVAANIVSPLLIIIIAVTALGGFCVPQYNLAVACRLLRYIMLASSCLWGFSGLAVGTFLVFVRVSSLESFGVPLLSPYAPKKPSNPDVFARLPVWMQKRAPGFMKTRPRRGAP